MVLKLWLIGVLMKGRVIWPYNNIAFVLGQMAVHSININNIEIKSSLLILGQVGKIKYHKSHNLTKNVYDDVAKIFYEELLLFHKIVTQSLRVIISTLLMI